ncbi:TonB-dependent receptor [Brevundimonas sp.]|uniref:TonB-dependent receptor n=1 Tax=Brevundimonas sp. TaxID=1871086 RepID=UPI003D0DE518
MSYRTLLALTSALVAVTAALPAHAQQATTPDRDSTQLDEVVVTAQRRSESAQRAAISVDAVTPQELENVGTNPGDLTRAVPSVQFNQVSGPYPQTSIRGVGNNPLNPYTDATVGFNYDGVPITRTTAVAGLYYDLQRVEVLKGPQGTFYGRNQTGGAVNIIPRSPVIGQLGGNLLVERGNYDLLRANGALNVPLGERAAVRAAFSSVSREGFYQSGLGDDVGESGRLTLRVEPSEDLTLQIGADVHHQGGKGGGSTLLNSTFSAAGGPPPFRRYVTDGQPLNGETWIDINDRCDGVDRSPTSTGSLDWDDWWYTTGASPCRVDGSRDDTFAGITGLIEWNVAGGTLTVIPARRTTNLLSQAVGTTNLRTDEESESKTVEARFASDDSQRFSYIVGAFYLDETVDSLFQIQPSYPNNLPTATNQVIGSTTESWAAFASGRLNITDSLRLTAGVRYTNDDKTFAGTSTAGAASVAVNASDSWSEVTYNAGIEYDLAEDSLLYLSYARGYKAGGFFFATPLAGFGSTAPAAPTTVTGNTYDPEFVNAITLGSKNYFLDRRLLLNFEVFQYEFEDQQVSQFGVDDWTPPFGVGGYNNTVFLTVNQGSVDIFGQELETRFLLSENTLLTLNVQHLDTEISGTITSGGLNTAGYPTLNAADWTGAAGIQQTIPLSNGAEIVADLRGQYRGNVWIGSTDYLPYMEAEPVVTADFSLTYDSGQIWRLTGYVNNFTDESVPVFYAGTGEARGSAAGPPSSPFTASYRAPRTYGVRLGLNF